MSTKNKTKTHVQDSHNKWSDYLVTYLPSLLVVYVSLSKNNIKSVLYSEIKQKDQQLYRTCFPLFFHKHLENLILYYNLINADQFIWYVHLFLFTLISVARKHLLGNLPFIEYIQPLTWSQFELLHAHEDRHFSP